jgi:hypothetical protein
MGDALLIHYPDFNVYYISGKVISNKEISRWDEAKDWEGVCIPSPIRAR